MIKMTRINVVSPTVLIDSHLGAEYRELPRVFGLVRLAIARGEEPNDPRNPKQYTLGKGHVRFFYPRLGFLFQRYLQLCAECRRRGRKVSYNNPEQLLAGIPTSWQGEWDPDLEAIKLNTARILERGG